jgi:ribosomal protein S18 acetylase RimI-like enzyme
LRPARRLVLSLGAHRRLEEGEMWASGETYDRIERLFGWPRAVAIRSRGLMIEVRAFEPTDQDAVVALWEACELVRPWNDPRKDIERKLQVEPKMFLVAIAGGVLAGSVMAGYEGHRGWINYLAVRPELQRRGVGARLMAEAERLLEEAGCPKINLQVRSENVDAIAFYRAIGYEIDDVVSLGKRLVEDQDPDHHGS